MQINRKDFLIGLGGIAAGAPLGMLAGGSSDPRHGRKPVPPPAQTAPPTPPANEPQWPEPLGALEFPIFYRGYRLRLRIKGREVQVSAGPGNQAPIEIECRGHVAHLQPGGTVRLS